MRKGIWRCIKRFPKPQVIVILCIIVLCDLLSQSIRHLSTTKVMEVYNHTGSVSEQSLEVLLCPMPRVHVGKAMYFGKYMPAFLNWKFYNAYILPSMTYTERNDTFADVLGDSYTGTSNNSSAESTNVTTYDVDLKNEDDEHQQEARKVLNMRKKVLLCLIHEMRQIRETDNAFTLTRSMQMRSKCWPKDITRTSDGLKVQQDKLWNIFINQYGPRMTEFLYAHFETLDERLLEEYDKLFENVRVMRREGKTLEMWLDYIGIDLSQHIDTEYVEQSARVLTGPMQSLNLSRLSTRMSPRCLRQSLVQQGRKGYQRAEIAYPFHHSCSRFKSFIRYTYRREFPPGSWCLSTKNMFLSVYISALNKFTDIPMAGAIVPYRVPIDQDTRVHVKVRQRAHTKNCKNYGVGSSEVTCVEGCLLAKVLRNITCNLPWLTRLQQHATLQDKQLKKKMETMGFCGDDEGLKRTIRTVRKIFDEEEAKECHSKCPRDCTELVVIPRIVGAVAAQTGAPKMELIISDSMQVYTDFDVYGLGQFMAEVMGNLSFFLGFSFVALYDWLIGVTLWFVGKLPFIPALKPLLKNELYTEGLCDTHEDDSKDEEEELWDDVLPDAAYDFIANAYRKNYRRLSTMKPPEDELSHRHTVSGALANRRFSHRKSRKISRVGSQALPSADEPKSTFGDRLRPDDAALFNKSPGETSAVSQRPQDGAPLRADQESPPFQPPPKNTPPKVHFDMPAFPKSQHQPRTAADDRVLPGIAGASKKPGVNVDYTLERISQPRPTLAEVPTLPGASKPDRNKRTYRTRAKRQAPR